MIEHAQSLDGLKMQVAVVLSLTFFVTSVIYFLITWSKNFTKSSYISTCGLLIGMLLFIYGTSNVCGCDFGSDYGGCSAACAYDWDTQFFTLDYAKGVLAGPHGNTST